ncbi:hypothetical protein V8F06_012094 [Rhypophila decipiens]
MDPVSTLAFSCNILDLVERGHTCCRTFKELYKAADGLSKQRTAILEAIESMQSVIDDLRSTRLSLPRSRTEKDKVDQSLLLVASRCEDLASDLAAAIEHCRVKKTGSLLSTAKAAVRALLTQDDIAKIELALQQRGETLHMLLLTCTHRDVAFLLDQIKATEIHHETRHSQVMQKLRQLDSQMGPAGFLQNGFKDAPMVRKNITEASELAKETQPMLNRQLILSSLKFLGNDMRMEEVHEAADETFGWILEVAADTSLGDPDEIKFAKWLKNGLGVFHVTGKPGSGKSTLMKYIVDDPRTSGLLAHWAGVKKLVISKFFLWRLGSREQKNFRGLTKGLLYSAVHSAPELIEFLFPQYWDPPGVISKSARMRVEFDITDRDVTNAFSRLVGGMPEIADRFQICFFIDGLDEFDEHQGVSFLQLRRNILQWTSALPESLKICVTSRQWPVFEGMASSESHKMSLHDLTQNDISKLVTNTLNNHENFQRLQTTDPIGCQMLINEVVNDAEGVFLWVTLILRSLEDGLSNNDPLSLLQSRVATTPQQLNEFFETIINSIDTEHRRSAYLLFAIVMRMTGSLISSPDRSPELRQFDLTLTANWTPENLPISYLSLLGASFLFWALDGNQPLDATTRPGTKKCEEEMAEKLKVAAVQVRGRCKGLVAVDKMNAVKFIHRTIPEYLQQYLGTRAQDHGISDGMIGQMLLWTLLAEVKYLGMRQLYSGPPDAALQRPSAMVLKAAKPVEHSLPWFEVKEDNDESQTGENEVSYDGSNDIQNQGYSPDEAEVVPVDRFVTVAKNNGTNSAMLKRSTDGRDHYSEGSSPESEPRYSLSTPLIEDDILRQDSLLNMQSQVSTPQSIHHESERDANLTAVDQVNKGSQGQDQHPILGCSLPVTELSLRELVRELTSGSSFDEGGSNAQPLGSLSPALCTIHTTPSLDGLLSLSDGEQDNQKDTSDARSGLALTKEHLQELESIQGQHRESSRSETSSDYPDSSASAHSTTQTKLERDKLISRARQGGYSGFVAGLSTSHVYLRGTTQIEIAHASEHHCTFFTTPAGYRGDCIEVSARFGYALSRLRQVDLFGQRKTFEILDALDREASQAQWAVDHPPDYLWDTVREPFFQETLRLGHEANHLKGRISFSFVGIAAFLGLHEYLAWRLEHMGDRFEPTSLFASYLLSNIMGGLLWSPSSVRLLCLKHLFGRGVSANLPMCFGWYPNHNADLGSVWHSYLFDLFCEHRGFHYRRVGDPDSSIPSWALVFDEENWKIVEICLEEGGADPEFAVFMKTLSRGFPEEREYEDCYVTLGCYAEVLPRAFRTEFSLIRDLIQRRTEQGKRKEAVALASRLIDQHQASHLMDDSKELPNMLIELMLNTQKPSFAGDIIRPWWTYLRHRLSAASRQQQENLVVRPSAHTDNMMHLELLRKFRASLEDIIYHLRPRDQAKLLSLIQKARQSRQPSSRWSFIREFIFRLHTRLRSATSTRLLPGVMRSFLVTRAVIEELLISQSTKIAFSAIRNARFELLPHVYVGK